MKTTDLLKAFPDHELIREIVGRDAVHVWSKDISERAKGIMSDNEYMLGPAMCAALEDILDSFNGTVVFADDEQHLQWVKMRAKLILDKVVSK